MTDTNYRMWTYWRDKYYNKADALKNCFPEVLAREPSLRAELIRIEAYESLIDKLMSAFEDAQADSDEDSFPMWRTYRDKYGYDEALQRQYGAELRKTEALRVAVQNIKDAEATIEKWMTEKADAQEEDE
jgi:predicted kinase